MKQDGFTQMSAVNKIGWRERLAKAPLPGVGKISDYDGAVDALAQALLVVAEERPELLDTTGLDSFEAADNRKLWDAANERFPGLGDWLGGITGFQWGCAHSVVRGILDADAVGNPALVTIGSV
jgi:hypothetical protein